MKPLRFFFLLAAMEAWIGSGIVPAAPAEPATPSIARLSASELDARLASFKGRIVLVNFWATWCPPCRLEIPGFVSLQSRYESKGLQIVGLSLGDESADAVAAFTRKNKINYPVFLVDDEVTKNWGRFEAIPMTFLIDAHGKRVWQHEGYASEELVEKQIQQLLPK